MPDEQTTVRIDIAEVRQKEREDYYRTEAPRPGLGDLFGAATPYFIIVVAIVAYALSAPHTAAVIDLLTPGVGWLAPVGVELSLIYTSFQRRRLQVQNSEPSQLLTWLRRFMFATAIVTNFAGALSAVVKSAGLEQLSGQEIGGRFGTLPVTVQVGLIMVFLMAVAVPIVAEAAGQGVADIIYSTRPDDGREVRWKRIERTRVYRAVFLQYVNTGLPETDAQVTAQRMVSAYYGQPVRDVPQLAPPVTPAVTAPDRPMTKMDQAVSLLTQHPDWMENSTRVLAERTGINRNTWAEAKAKVKETVQQ